MSTKLTAEQTAAIIETAIKTKSPVQFTYDGKVRTLCPHLLGETGKGFVVQGYQYLIQHPADLNVTFDGEKGWRYFYLDKVVGGIKTLESSLSEGGAKWQPEPDPKLEKKEYQQPRFIDRVVAMVSVE